jgi:hypothetical protein
MNVAKPIRRARPPDRQIHQLPIFNDRNPDLSGSGGRPDHAHAIGKSSLLLSFKKEETFFFRCAGPSFLKERSKELLLIGSRGP